MREFAALTGRLLRTSWRGRALRITCVLYASALAVLCALTAQERSGAAAFLVLGALGALALGLAGLAAGAGQVLPADRHAGREAWLATLAPPGWKRRAAVVAAAWLLAVGAGALGGLLAGAGAGLASEDVAMREHASLPLPADAVLSGTRPLPLPLPPQPEGAPTLEIEVQPLFRHGVLPADRVELVWQAAAQTHRMELSVRGPLQMQVPPEAREVTLALRTPHVRLRLVEARWLGPPRSGPGSLALAGLLLGLLAGTVAPVAVLVSRATTSQTAVAAAFALLCLAALKSVLGDLSVIEQPRGVGAVASAVLHLVGWIAPPAPLPDVVAGCAALRAPGWAEFALVLPAALYTLMASVLACVPAPRRMREGRNP